MQFSIKVGSLSAFALGLFATFGASPAAAQATRTWVAGTGDDANPCSRTAPCQTFAGAMVKTAAGGEIDCIEPGGFGPVTISKSIAIICDNTEAGVIPTGPGSVITVNAGATDVVYLSGLDIEGQGTGNGQNGVRFIAGGTLHIEHSVIRGFNAASGWGVLFQPSGASQLTITNTVIADNGAGGISGGIQIAPTGAGGAANVALRDVRIQNNNGVGLRIDSTGNTGSGISVSLENVQSTGNAQGVSVLNPPNTTTIGVMIVGSTIALNSSVGLFANGGAVTVRVSDTEITGNSLGVNALGGSTVQSYGDNNLDGNPASTSANNGAFTGAVTPKK
jgi:hypothetical protein